MSFIGPITKTAIFVASALIIIARAANAANAANAPAAVPAPVRRMANQDEASIIEGGKEDEEEEEVKVEEDEESVEGESIVEAGEFRFQGQVQEGEDVASAVEDEGHGEETVEEAREAESIEVKDAHEHDNVPAHNESAIEHADPDATLVNDEEEEEAPAREIANIVRPADYPVAREVRATLKRKADSNIEAAERAADKRARRSSAPSPVPRPVPAPPARYSAQRAAKRRLAEEVDEEAAEQPVEKRVRRVEPAAEAFVPTVEPAQAESTAPAQVDGAASTITTATSATSDVAAPAPTIAENALERQQLEYERKLEDLRAAMQAQAREALAAQQQAAQLLQAAEAEGERERESRRVAEADRERVVAQAEATVQAQKGQARAERERIGREAQAALQAERERVEREARAAWQAQAEEAGAERARLELSAADATRHAHQATLDRDSARAQAASAAIDLANIRQQAEQAEQAVGLARQQAASESERRQAADEAVTRLQQQLAEGQQIADQANLSSQQEQATAAHLRSRLDSMWRQRRARMERQGWSWRDLRLALLQDLAQRWAEEQGHPEVKERQVALGLALVRLAAVQQQEQAAYDSSEVDEPDQAPSLAGLYSQLFPVPVAEDDLARAAELADALTSVNLGPETSPVVGPRLSSLFCKRNAMFQSTWNGATCMPLPLVNGWNNGTCLLAARTSLPGIWSRVQANGGASVDTDTNVDADMDSAPAPGLTSGLDYASTGWQPPAGSGSQGSSTAFGSGSATVEASAWGSGSGEDGGNDSSAGVMTFPATKGATAGTVPTTTGGSESGSAASPGSAINAPVSASTPSAGTGQTSQLQEPSGSQGASITASADPWRQADFFGDLRRVRRSLSHRYQDCAKGKWYAQVKRQSDIARDSDYSLPRRIVAVLFVRDAAMHLRKVVDGLADSTVGNSTRAAEGAQARMDATTAEQVMSQLTPLLPQINADFAVEVNKWLPWSGLSREQSTAIADTLQNPKSFCPAMEGLMRTSPFAFHDPVTLQHWEARTDVKQVAIFRELVWTDGALARAWRRWDGSS